MAFRHTKQVLLSAQMTDRHKGPPVKVVDWYRLGAWMAEAPTVKELRSMSDVVKEANLGVKQHGIRPCTLSQCGRVSGK